MTVGKKQVDGAQRVGHTVPKGKEWIIWASSKFKTSAWQEDIEKNEKTSHGLGDSITNHIVDKGLSSGICKHSQTSLLKSCLLRKSTGDLIFTHTCVFLMLYSDTQMEFKEVICILFLKTTFTSKMK